MKRTLEHPSQNDARADYGFDRALGFFTTVYRNARVVAEYDGLQPGYDGLNGAIQILVDAGFFDRWQFDLALEQLQYTLPEDLEPSLQLPARVFMEMKAAAD